MVTEVVFASEMGSASARGNVRAAHEGLVLRAFASRPRRLHFLNKKGPSRLKGQPCCRAMKR